MLRIAPRALHILNFLRGGPPNPPPYLPLRRPRRLCGTVSHRTPPGKKSWIRPCLDIGPKCFLSPPPHHKYCHILADILILDGIVYGKSSQVRYQSQLYCVIYINCCMCFQQYMYMCTQTLFKKCPRVFDALPLKYFL